MYLKVITIFILLSSFIGQSQTFSPYVSEVPVRAMYEVARYKQQQYYQQQLYNKRIAFNNYWKEIEKINWSYKDSFSSPYSSFLKAGWYRYYSEESNFLLLQMNENFYLFKNVPYKLWKGLLNASSKGEYYNYYIRGRYLIATNTLQY